MPIAPSPVHRAERTERKRQERARSFESSEDVQSVLVAPGAVNFTFITRPRVVTAFDISTQGRRQQIHTAADSVLDRLPVSYSQNNHRNTNCVVCISEISTGEAVRTLPCMHFFHKDCIDQWLKTNMSCPVCKRTVSV